MPDNKSVNLSKNITDVASEKQLHEFASAPGAVRSAIKGLSDLQVHYKSTPQEWSINEIIIHLADTEMFFYERIRKIIVEDTPVLQSFNQDNWANNLFYEKQN